MISMVMKPKTRVRKPYIRATDVMVKDVPTHVEIPFKVADRLLMTGMTVSELKIVLAMESIRPRDDETSMTTIARLQVMTGCKRSTIMKSIVTMERQRASHEMPLDASGDPQPKREFPLFEGWPTSTTAGMNALRIKMPWSWEWRAFCHAKGDHDGLIRIRVEEFRGYRTICGLLMRIRFESWLGSRNTIERKLRPDDLPLLSGYVGRISRNDVLSLYVAKGWDELERLCDAFESEVGGVYLAATRKMRALRVALWRTGTKRRRSRSPPEPEIASPIPPARPVRKPRLPAYQPNSQGN